jgi:hypothetical protein
VAAVWFGSPKELKLGLFQTCVGCFFTFVKNLQFYNIKLSWLWFRIWFLKKIKSGSGSSSNSKKSEPTPGVTAQW